MNAALQAWRATEHALDRVATPAGNPLRHLGAVACAALALLAASGVVLYAAYDTSAAGAHASLARLGAGGAALRSLHRFAADVLVAATLAHLAREALHGHFAPGRRAAWWTGLALLAAIPVSAIGGMWLPWDRVAQFAATGAAEWLDALPLPDTPLTRNVLTDAAVADRLFSLLVFVHLGVALLLVLGLWAHVQRLSRAELLPPRPLLVGTGAALAALALAWPIPASGPAALARAEAVPLDWWALGALPLAQAASPPSAWVILLAVGASLVALPWLRRGKRVAAARVDPAHCNGCRRCEDDCPFEAVTMAPHPTRAQHQVAVVDPLRCLACGVCTGACPSSTPLRRAGALATGIDLPQRPIDAVRAELRAGLEAAHDHRPVALFGCDHGVDVAAHAAPDVVAVSLPCTGMLPPAFADEALRRGAAAVVVSGCRDGGCEFRLGARWARERLAGTREPRLRAVVPRERVHWVDADREEGAVLAAALARVRVDITREVHP